MSLEEASTSPFGFEKEKRKYLPPQGNSVTTLEIVTGPVAPSL
jgi:hypothetical protein